MSFGVILASEEQARDYILPLKPRGNSVTLSHKPM